MNSSGIYIVFITAFCFVEGQYSLVTSEPFATRDKEFILTCNIGFTETGTVLTWSRNGVSVVYIRLSDCSEGDPGRGLYNLYRYNCTTSTRQYNLIIYSPRINSEADTQWQCGRTGGGADSNTYTLQFYTPPTRDPVITGYDGSPRFLGNTVILRCTVDGGIPLATLFWTCKGVSVPGTSAGTSTHTVTIDASYNGHICTCTASHPTWSEQKVVRCQNFVVYSKPLEDPVIKGYDGSVYYHGDTVTLTCRVSGGSPLANLSWTCNGEEQIATQSTISDTMVTSVLTVAMAKLHNGKTCICNGRHSDPSYKPDISSKPFLVYYPPSIPSLFPSQLSPFPWIEGGSGTLNCMSQPGNPPTTAYQWIRENVKIPGETGTSLILTSLTKNNNRQSYKCKVLNAYTVYKQENLTSSPKQLNVEYRPVIDIGRSPAYVHETESFERDCKVDSNPNATVTWTPNRNPSNEATLKLINIIRNQTGDYKCIAQAQSNGEHGLLYNQDVLKVIVQYPPIVQTVLSSPTVKEGEGIMLFCKAQGVPDLYTYSGWTHIYKNRIIRTSNDFSIVSQDKRNLTLLEVSYQDIGTYKCSASNGVPDKNGVKNQEGRSELDIKFSAVFNSSKKFYSELNRAVEIKIPFLCNPSVQIDDISLTRNNKNQNSKNGVTVQVGNRTLGIEFYDKLLSISGQEVIVTMQSFSSEQQGNYTIGVKNFQEGPVSTFAFEVIPSGPPNKPKRFDVLSKSSKTITVTWLKGFNGGHTQTFVVLYRQKGSREQPLFKEVVEEDNRNNYTLTIKNLLALTEYDFWIYSYNIKGNDTNDFKDIIPLALKTAGFLSDQENHLGIVIGGVAAIVCVIIALAVMIGVYRIKRRSQIVKGKSDALTKETLDQYEDLKTERSEESVYNSIQCQNDGYEDVNSFSRESSAYKSLEISDQTNTYRTLNQKDKHAIPMERIYVNTVLK